MNLLEWTSLISLLLVVGNLVFNAYNGFQFMEIKLHIAEMRLNLMREMNGRYERVETSTDLKRRVERLENKEIIPTAVILKKVE